MKLYASDDVGTPVPMDEDEQADTAKDGTRMGAGGGAERDGPDGSDGGTEAASAIGPSEPGDAEFEPPTPKTSSKPVALNPDGTPVIKRRHRQRVSFVFYWSFCVFAFLHFCVFVFVFWRVGVRHFGVFAFLAFFSF